MGWRVLARLWRYPRYPRFCLAATLARVANEMFPVGVVLLILEETGDAALAGGAVAALTFPSLVTGPLLGAWFDWRPRPVLGLAADQLVGAIAFLGLALAVDSGAGVVLLLSLLAGITFPLSGGGFTSLLAMVVDGEELDDAITVEAADFHLAIVVGPALAGALTDMAGAFVAVVAQAGLKLGALALLLTFYEARRPVVRVARGTWGTIVAGLTHVWRSTPVLSVTVAGAVSLGGRGLLVVAFPLFALESLDASEAYAAVLWAAFALGSIGGILTGGVRGRLPDSHVVLLAIAAQGLVMLTWPLAGSPVTATALVALAGAAYGPGLAATLAVRQRFTPEGLRGQVFATSIALKPGTFAIGAALGGPLVTYAGVETTLLIAAITQLAAAAAGASVLRRDGGL